MERPQVIQQGNKRQGNKAKNMCRDIMTDLAEDWWNSYDDPWERLYDVARIVVFRKPNADFFDLFNFIREDILSGWKMDEDSYVVRRIDAEVAYEYDMGKV